MTFFLAYDLFCQLFLFLRNIACCVILENTDSNVAVLLTFKKPLLYPFYVMLLYGYDLFACMFNQFLKFQLLATSLLLSLFQWHFSCRIQPVVTIVN